MTQTVTNLTAAAVTLLSTELNSLANNALVVSSVGGSSGVFDNTIGGGGVSSGYQLGDIEGTFTFGTSPTANTGINIWFLETIDATNYESGSSSVTPARAPDLVLPLIAQTAKQIVNVSRVLLPAGKFTVLAQNAGTGQSLASSANTVKVRPVTPQGQAT